MFGIREKAAHTAKRAGLLSGGLLFCLIGLLFFTTAAWFGMVAVMDKVSVALIIGGAYAGIGLILIGFGMSSKTPKETPYAAQSSSNVKSEGPPIVQAFMYGLQAGAQADQKRH